MTRLGTDHVLLGMIPLFANLSESLLEKIANLSRLRTYPQGQILFNEGDPGDDLVVLESGLLRISRFLADGTEAVLSVLEAPAVLGELALLDGSPRDATVTAQRPVSVRLIPRAVFLQLLEGEPSLTQGLVKSLVAMVREGNDRHADYLGLDVPGRLAKWLLQQSHVHGAHDEMPGRVVEMHCSQGELAAELGTTRSTLNRALQDFQSLGLIRLHGLAITLLKPDTLHSYTT